VGDEDADQLLRFGRAFRGGPHCARTNRAFIYVDMDLASDAIGFLLLGEQETFLARNERLWRQRPRTPARVPRGHPSD